VTVRDAKFLATNGSIFSFRVVVPVGTLGGVVLMQAIRMTRALISGVASRSTAQWSYQRSPFQGGHHFRTTAQEQ
jgi:hypothetical protein